MFIVNRNDFFLRLIIGNEIVTQTIELMNHTDTVSSWMDTYNDDSVCIRNTKRIRPFCTHPQFLSYLIESVIRQLSQRTITNNYSIS